ncbi:hypothetical protein LAL4801_05833 [Roseibium aggregatum]|uniref:Uncharacterized protein n=1 Tax=Roseibium aggregatum TaxID=187304 RepID=A0A0M6YEC9_9HYPH|nr:hypothetical protein LAL4801_05833 [Roseibium aggregatum]
MRWGDMVSEVLTVEKVVVLEFSGVLEGYFVDVAWQDSRLDRKRFEELVKVDFIENFLRRLWEMNEPLSDQMLLTRYATLHIIKYGALNFTFDALPGSIKIENGKIVVESKIILILGMLWLGLNSGMVNYPNVREGLVMLAKDLNMILTSSIFDTAADRNCRVETLTVKNTNPALIQQIINKCVHESRLNEYYQLKQQIKDELRSIREDGENY